MFGKNHQGLWQCISANVKIRKATWENGPDGYFEFNISDSQNKYSQERRL